MARQPIPGPDDEAEMTAKAAEAFARYVAMGPGRSLRNLAYSLAEQGVYKTSTGAMRSLADWSKKYHWQSRLAAAATARGEELQAKALEWDDTTFLRTSELLAKQMAELDPARGAGEIAMKVPLIDLVIKVRETVRRREPRGSQANANASANLSFAVGLRNIVEQVAAEEGIDAEQLLARTEKMLIEARG